MTAPLQHPSYDRRVRGRLRRRDAVAVTVFVALSIGAAWAVSGPPGHWVNRFGIVLLLLLLAATVIAAGFAGAWLARRLAEGARARARRT